jgi:O-antigen ligase
MENYFLPSWRAVDYDETNVVNKYVRMASGLAILLVAVSLPLHLRFNSICMILLGVTWFFEGHFKLKFRMLMERRIILVFCAFYFLFLAGMLYTENTAVGLFNLEKKITLVLIPLFMGTSLSYDKSIRDKVFFWFVVSNLFATILCLFLAVKRYMTTGDSVVFFYEELSNTIGMHPPYFSMFLSMCSMIILFYMWEVRARLKSFQQWLLALIVIYIFIFMILLSARTAMIFIMFFFVTVGLYLFHRAGRLRAGLAILAVMLISLFVIVSQSTVLRERYIAPIVNDITISSGGGETGLSIRLVKWKCGLSCISEAPLLGAGTGDGLDILLKCYEKVNFWGMYPEFRYNAHEQYLETGIALGLIGVFALLLTIILPLIRAWKRRDWLFVSFLALFSFCCLTESLLERQWGIVFFTFFTSVFYFGTSAKVLEDEKNRKA